MKANYYNHMNRMNRSNTASKQIRRTIRIDRKRMELRPDEPPDIRRVLEQLDQQSCGNTEPKIQTRTIADLLKNDEDAVEGETYEISSQCELNDFIAYVNGKRNTTGVTFKLIPLEDGKEYNVTQIIAPITLTSDDDTNSPVPVANSVCFNGTLDGGYVPPDSEDETQKHSEGETQKQIVTIRISIDESAATATTLHAVGLFGAIGVNGSVENLTLTGKVSAGADAGAVGALAGYNSGYINKVTITDETTIKAPDSYNVGGIVGFNDALYVAGARGTIRNSANNGTVTGYEKVGGICGENSGLIGSCSNSGMVQAMSNRRSGTGGIAGRNGNNNTALEIGQIFDCYNTGFIVSGTVTAIVENDDTKKLGQWVGGITGFQNSRSECNYCYNTGSLLGYNRVHSIIGENDHFTTETKEDGTKVKVYLGVTNCYGMEDKVVSGEVQVDTDGSEEMSEAQMEKTTFLALLNADGVYWEPSGVVDKSLPALKNNYEDKLDGENVTGRPTFTKVYLDAYDGGKITTSGKDPQYPFHNLADAVAAAGVGGTVVLTQPITINQATGLYDNVNYERGFIKTSDAGKAMFEIDIPNVTMKNADTNEDEPALGYLTMTTATIDGGGSGTLFHVVHGRLRLRGDITLENCETAVLVEGQQGTTANPLNAQVEVNYATIKETGTAIKLVNANSDFILDAFSEVSISGTIYLGPDAFITVETAIPDKLDVVKEMGNDDDIIVAKGTSTYNLSDNDLEMLISDTLPDLGLENNEIFIF